MTPACVPNITIRPWAGPLSYDKNLPPPGPPESSCGDRQYYQGPTIRYCPHRHTPPPPSICLIPHPLLRAPGDLQGRAPGGRRRGGLVAYSSNCICSNPNRHLRPEGAHSDNSPSSRPLARPLNAKGRAPQIAARCSASAPYLLRSRCGGAGAFGIRDGFGAFPLAGRIACQLLAVAARSPSRRDIAPPREECAIVASAFWFIGYVQSA